jgi:hypothetical protein
MRSVSRGAAMNRLERIHTAHGGGTRGVAPGGEIPCVADTARGGTQEITVDGKEYIDPIEMHERFEWAAISLRGALRDSAARHGVPGCMSRFRVLDQQGVELRG